MVQPPIMLDLPNPLFLDLLSLSNFFFGDSFQKLRLGQTFDKLFVRVETPKNIFIFFDTGLQLLYFIIQIFKALLILHFFLHFLFFLDLPLPPELIIFFHKRHNVPSIIIEFLSRFEKCKFALRCPSVQRAYLVFELFIS